MGCVRCQRANLPVEAGQASGGDDAALKYNLPDQFFGFFFLDEWSSVLLWRCVDALRELGIIQFAYCLFVSNIYWTLVSLVFEKIR